MKSKITHHLLTFASLQFHSSHGTINSNNASHSSLPTKKLAGDADLYQWNGFWFMLHYLQETQEVLNHFKPLSTDVILASLPKTGTTWLKSLLYSIINCSSKDSIITNHPHELIPSLEVQKFGTQEPSYALTNTNSSTRIFSTHIPYQILAKTIDSSDCRIVYITRNPKDTLISMWQFVQKAKKIEKPWPLEVAVKEFCSGVVPFGPYYDHVIEYWKESLERADKVFFITYEEMKIDAKTHVKRLAKFLGCPFEGDDAEKVVDEIVRNCSFEKRSKYEVNKSSDVTPWLTMPYNAFFRQGEVGDHKNYLDSEMIKRIAAITPEKFHGSGFMFGI